MLKLSEKFRDFTNKNNKFRERVWGEYCPDTVFLKGEDFFHDLRAIKHYAEHNKNDSLSYYMAHLGTRDTMREELFGLIADGEISYPVEQLCEFYFAVDTHEEEEFGSDSKETILNCGVSYWSDETAIMGNKDKYPNYARMMGAIEKRIENEIGIRNLSSEQRTILLERTNDIGLAVKLLGMGGLENKEIIQRLKDLKPKEQQLKDNNGQIKKLQGYKDLLEHKESTEKTFLEGVGISERNKYERRGLFNRCNRLRQEHPVMQDVSLTTMCRIYVAEDDKEMKLGFLKELYQIRKEGKTNAEKNKMADTFARVLDNAPELKKDDNLVRLSKRDTFFGQPTGRIKKQVEKSKS